MFHGGTKINTGSGELHIFVKVCLLETDIHHVTQGSKHLFAKPSTQKQVKHRSRTDSRTGAKCAYTAFQCIKISRIKINLPNMHEHTIQWLNSAKLYITSLTSMNFQPKLSLNSSHLWVPLKQKAVQGMDKTFYQLSSPQQKLVKHLKCFRCKKNTSLRLCSLTFK